MKKDGIDMEFSVGEVRETLRLFYNDKCRIDWCTTHINLSKKQRDQTKIPTLEHIIPKKHGGTDHLHNLTYTVEYCNSQKGHDISDEKLIKSLQREAKKHELAVLKILVSKHINPTGSHRGFCRIRILTIVYELKITRKGNICILSARGLTNNEKESIKKRDLDTYAASP